MKEFIMTDTGRFIVRFLIIYSLLLLTAFLVRASAYRKGKQDGLAEGIDFINKLLDNKGRIVLINGSIRAKNITTPGAKQIHIFGQRLMVTDNVFHFPKNK